MPRKGHGTLRSCNRYGAYLDRCLHTDAVSQSVLGSQDACMLSVQFQVLSKVTRSEDTQHLHMQSCFGHGTA